MLKSFACLLILSSVFASCGYRQEQISEVQSQTSGDECAPQRIFNVEQLPAQTQSVLRVSKAVLIATCSKNESGWTFISWKNYFEIEIKNLAYEKRIAIQRLESQFPERIVLDPAKVQYLGVTEDGFDRFAFSISENLSNFVLSAIVPARFNPTPNIGNPQPGWTGPTYSMKLTLAD